MPPINKSPGDSPSRLSDSIANSIVKVYKAGQLGLVFIFIGLLLIIFAQFFSTNNLSLPTFWVGTFLIIISFILFLFQQLKTPIGKNKSIEGKEVMDNLQDLSVSI